MLARKRARRVPVGPYLSFLFENRETVLFQIQEMCRAERIVDDARVQEEIDVYGALLPGAGELSAYTQRAWLAATPAFRPARLLRG